MKRIRVVNLVRQRMQCDGIHIERSQWCAFTETDAEAVGECVDFAEKKFPSSEGWSTGGQIGTYVVPNDFIEAAYKELHLIEPVAAPTTNGAAT